MEKINIKQDVHEFFCPTANMTMKKAMELPPVRPLFKSLWHERELCILFAETNLGKSIYAMQIAESIAKKEKVMYLDFELSLSQFRSRYSNSETNDAYVFSDNLYRPSLEIERSYTDDEAVKRMFTLMVAAAEQENIKIFVIDNITFLCGKLENGTVATRIMKELTKLKHLYGLSILVIAHTHKRNPNKEITADDLAGSKKLMNFFDSSFCIGKSQNENGILYIKQIKVREGEFVYHKDNVLTCSITKQDNFIQFIEEGFAIEGGLLCSKPQEKSALREYVFLMHNEGLSNRAIAKELGISEGSIRNWLKDYNCNSLGNGLAWHFKS